jgi:hypothetical protein
VSHQFIGTIESWQNTHDGRLSGIFFKEYKGRVPVSKYENTEVPKLEVGQSYYVTINDKGWVYKMAKMDDKKATVLENVNKYDRDRTIARQACLNYAINAASNGIVPKPTNIDELFATAEMFVSWVYGEPEPDDTELPTLRTEPALVPSPVANIVAHNGDRCCKACYWTHNEAKWRGVACSCACHASERIAPIEPAGKVASVTEPTVSIVTSETENALPFGLVRVAR